MSMYLEDHPPARSQFRNPRRADPTGAIVIHTAENATDLTLPDAGAENVARFISTRTTPGSYHSIVDSDSIEPVCKYEWEAFGEGTGGNRWSLHLAWACRAGQWPALPAEWVVPAINNGAIEAANMARWVRTTVGVTVPARRITATDYRNGLPGFVTHADLDPGRRTDPGEHFPWRAFLAGYAHQITLTPGDPPMPMTAAEQAPYITRIQQATNRMSDAGIDEDGMAGELTAAAVEGLEADGSSEAADKWWAFMDLIRG